MIARVVFFKNGNVAVFDEKGKQMPQWQGNAFVSYLDRMVEFGPVDEETLVEFEVHVEGVTAIVRAASETGVLEARELEGIRREAAGRIFTHPFLRPTRKPGDIGREP